MDRVYNFSSGPSALPVEVLEKAREELLNYSGTGMSVMEMPIGSPEFEAILDSAEKSMRELLEIPANYKVLFLQGGAETQYAAIPINLLSDHKCADYIITGQSSRDAFLEAKKYGDIAIVASSAGASPVYNAIPRIERSSFRPDADYVYMCYTNMAYGTKYNYIPDTGSIPLVADMTGFLFSEPVDVSKFGLIFASAESGFGIAGLTVVIIRDDLMLRVDPSTPSTLNYKMLADNRSMFNTPPVFNIYMTKLMLGWMLSIGGLMEIKRRNERKASVLYDFLDASRYYTVPVDSSCRSMLVVRFITGDSARDEKFIKEAEKAGLCNLKGEVNIGGMAAAIYNAMPAEGVDALVKFMREFQQDNPNLDAYLFDNEENEAEEY